MLRPETNGACHWLIGTKRAGDGHKAISRLAARPTIYRYKSLWGWRDGFWGKEGRVFLQKSPINIIAIKVVDKQINKINSISEKVPKIEKPTTKTINGINQRKIGSFCLSISFATDKSTYFLVKLAKFFSFFSFLICFIYLFAKTPREII